MNQGDEDRRVKAFKVCRHIIDLVRDPDVSITDLVYKEDGSELKFGIKIDKNTVVKAEPNTEDPYQ